MSECFLTEDGRCDTSMGSCVGNASLQSDVAHKNEHIEVTRRNDRVYAALEYNVVLRLELFGINTETCQT